MFDLIGFWFVVSLICMALLSPILLFSSLAGEHLVWMVTKDKELLERYTKYICTCNYSAEMLTILNKFKLHIGLFVALIASGIIAWIATLVSISRGNPETMFELVAWWATKAAPIAGYVGVLALTYVGITYVGRIFWKLKVKVDEVIEKTKD